MIKRRDDIQPPKDNVKITIRDKAGKVVDVRTKHNIFVDQGREWNARLAAGQDFGVMAYPQVIAYMGFGSGGILQDVATERTAQAEVSSVTTLDSKGITFGASALGAVFLDATSTDLRAIQGTVSTPPTTAKFSAILTTADISFPTGPDGVPLSEAGLFIVNTVDVGFTPNVVPASKTHVDMDSSAPPPGGTGPTPLLVAYTQFRTITKTDLLTLQFDWELRY